MTRNMDKSKGYLYEKNIERKDLTSGIAYRDAIITWSLNNKVDLQTFKTVFKDGLLTIVLPLIKDEENE